MCAYIADRYEVLVAPETTYGQFRSDASAYQEIRPEQDGFDHQGKTEFLKRETIRADLGNTAGLPGASSCSVKMKLPARGGGIAAASGMTAELCPELDKLTRCCFSQVQSDSGLNIASGSSDIVRVAQALPGNSLTLGGLVFVDPDGSDNAQGRWISFIDNIQRDVRISGHWFGGDNWQLDDTPTDEGLLYAATQCQPGSDSPGSCCLQISGLSVSGSQPVWTYSGLVGDLSIEDSSAGKRVLLGYELKGDQYSALTGSPTISKADGATSWPVSPADLRALSADFRINGLPVAYQSFSLSIGNEWGEIVDATSATGRHGFALTRIATQGKAVVYWDAEHMLRLQSGDKVDISWIVGNAANGIGFHAPAAELRSIKEQKINGLLGMEIGFAPVCCDIDGVGDWTLAFCGTTQS